MSKQLYVALGKNRPAYRPATYTEVLEYAANLDGAKIVDTGWRPLKTYVRKIRPGHRHLAAIWSSPYSTKETPNE